MSHLVPGHAAPAFSLHDQNGKLHKLSDYKGCWVVLYAYPRDLTPGCTIEAVDFTALWPEFEALGVPVLGISPDTVAKHQSFCTKKELKHILLADPDHQVIEAYGAWQLKKFMGKESMGVIRSTWLIAPAGNIHAVWSPVSVKGHAQEVLDAVKKAIG
jgi:thioredoxin-dependent peroxiredoxin